MSPLLSIILLSIATTAWAILPLPYPTEPMDEELRAGEIPLRDPKSFQGYSELFSRSQLREMELPAFGTQAGALGYKSHVTFNVPASLRNRVEFWKQVYAEYTSSQAILHDTESPEIIYGVVDVGGIMNDMSLSYRAKMRQVNRMMKGEKDLIARKLLELHAIKDNPLAISLDLFPLFRKFESKKNPDRFLKASRSIRTQIGQRDRIVRGYLYGGRYFTRMMDIFDKKKIPKELTRLPLVESAFNLNARSKVGASGVWQFMRSTGKRFLRIDQAVDERNDPISASWAAAELLRQNYESLESWPLAITAYNHGRQGMARAVRELATKDIGEIIRRYRSPSFGFASSNFYASFLAILEVERDYRKYFGEILVDKPLEYEEFHVGDNVRFVDLAGACGTDEQELAVLNPALTDWVLSGEGFVPQGYLLRIPAGKKEKCRSGYRNVTPLSSFVLDTESRKDDDA